ncbi:MAG: HAMP domain-containing sensor histidine kinase [bacterium]
MRQLKLVTKLKLIVGGLSTLVTTFSVLALAGLVYISAEVQIKSRLIEQANTLLLDNIKIVDGNLKLEDAPDGTTLATRLREFNLSLYLYDNKQASFAQYGFYQDLTPDLIKILLSENLIENVEQSNKGIYKDFTVTKYGLYDTYTLPLRTENEVLGFMQLSSQNTVWQILLSSVAWAIVFLFPLIWLVSYFAATRSAAIALAPLLALVTHLNKFDPEHLPKEITIDSKLDSEVAILTKSFNLLLTRISETLAKQREVVENISHELKTPLTRISSSLDVLSSIVNQSEKSRFDKIRHEIIALGGNVDAILSMATESPSNNVHTFIVSPIVASVVRALPETQRVIINLPPHFAIRFDPSVLRIVLRNLIDNAVKYGEIGSEITLTGNNTNDGWQIEIANMKKSEDVIDKNLLLRKVRGRGHVEGYGIGLDLVRELCQQNAVELRLFQDLKGKVVVIISGRN